MSVPLTLLGLLEREPSHGYDLKRDYDAYFGRDKPVPYGQVYATLSRLARDGMARYTRWSRRLSIVAPPSGRARQSESGQTVRSIIPTSRRTITKLKPPPAQTSDRGAGEHAVAAMNTSRVST